MKKRECIMSSANLRKLEFRLEDNSFFVNITSATRTCEIEERVRRELASRSRPVLGFHFTDADEDETKRAPLTSE